MIASQGHVESVTDEHIVVVVECQRRGACGACSEAGSCLTANSSGNIVIRHKIPRTPDLADYAVGDAVIVRLSKRAFWAALAYGYGLPTLLAIGAMALTGWLVQAMRYTELMMAGGAVIGAAIGIVIAARKNVGYRVDLTRADSRESVIRLDRIRGPDDV